MFAEGSYVREGQALYELDSRTNRATFDNAKAALLQQEANLSTLRTKLNRYQQLVSSNAVAKQDYDDLVGQVNVAEAQVAAARAQVKNAEVDLGYSTIRSPISGQTNRSTVTAGALVTANQTEPLVTIQRLDPIYVDINQSSSELLRLRQQLSKGSLDSSNNTRVKLKLEDGSDYPVEGRLAFSDAQCQSRYRDCDDSCGVPEPESLVASWYVCQCTNRSRRNPECDVSAANCSDSHTNRSSDGNDCE